MSRLSVRVRRLTRAIADFKSRAASSIRYYGHLKEVTEAGKTEFGIQAANARIDHEVSQILQDLKASKSQFGQDLFVLSELGFRRNGFFVEFGATDGVYLSNTHLLEYCYGWSGILAEPASHWLRALTKNRSCAIDRRCVWHTTGEVLRFSEPRSAEFATISQFVSSDMHGAMRADAREYDVETVSLMDLLTEHNAPSRIDYISIDTEGSEFEILNAFDFDKYDVRTVTCEHNHTDQRERIYGLLTSAGFVRKFEELSGVDDWYVKVDQP
ncbi:FkbM family methyltransferase [Hoeflea sp. TYP-13]|uniref:FkbM family methyltransferase n=1 Tax=Hoeflea sp. TYP-13 TaxID=3230023 RepID=UPI0034C63DD9